MKIFPAIDIIDGQCVRLTKGLAEQKSIYANSPVEMAKLYQDKGFDFIHVVALDATLGKGNNDSTLKKIRESIQIKVEVAGGIRSLASIKEKINLGFDLIVIGTLAIKNMDEVTSYDSDILEKLSIALDIKDNQIASHGWTKKTNLSLNTVLQTYNPLPINSYFVTDVANDGMLSGLNMDTFKLIKNNTNKPITIGGGVKDLNDIKLSKEQGFDNVVIGKAIYENKINLDELVKFNA
jgi:phosphoribosylformimino-5-aminoimidazole carboxamide ribotide isomerase